ncbi:unnamed protein product [Arabis nemorensis]|uniref:Uncharacterized protein n=1 Tax=Arabis nemorensis TaxID=586526 RepID=A0A565BY15_9BRAS|nr:unnamed protein product [Arabis nemorensis]
MLIQAAITAVESTLSRHQLILQSVSLMIESSLEKAKKEIQQGHKDGARHELRIKSLYEEEAKSIRQEIYDLEKEMIQLNSLIKSHDRYEALRKSKEGMRYKLDELADAKELLDDINEHKEVTGQFNKMLTQDAAGNHIEEELDLLQNDFN